MSSPARPLRVAVAGALGRMGERLRAALETASDAELAGALEAPGHTRQGEALSADVRVSGDPSVALAEADVVVDFSVPAATLRLLGAARERKLPCVIGTTGFSATGRVELERVARDIPIVVAPNFSIAVNVLVHLTAEAARLLGDAFDAEIVELHHAAKRDAPSGTALRLGEVVAEARGRRFDELAVLARQGETGPRPTDAIGIQALRGGDNPGEHSVFFLGRGERLELVHRAATRDHFALGALRAARWVAGRTPGLYGMEQVLGLRA